MFFAWPSSRNSPRVGCQRQSQSPECTPTAQLMFMAPEVRKKDYDEKVASWRKVRKVGNQAVATASSVVILKDRR